MDGNSIEKCEKQMKDKLEIPITEEELRFIVKDEFDTIMGLAKHNSYCRNCFRTHKEIEMINYKLLITKFNDVLFKGQCKSCNDSIARCIEIGENPVFSARVETIRSKDKNLN